MKLKYNFVVKKFDEHSVAVAVGKDNADFRGMIKLNETGSFIFERLSSDTTAESIAAEMTQKYDVSEEEAAAAVMEFTERLRANGLLEE